ncbi:hypothetical protein SAMD00019534_013670, partial [Acytostelium subglobosum LB1]|uniref:hypothetical protein n=1 Tax=Acytostelium subglobosum LB1 TaxID=1410327 RepID=UPI000644E1A7
NNNTRKCKIIFATQSGTSQEVAERLSMDVYGQSGVATSVLDIEQYDFKMMLPRERCVVFVVSTQGHGDVPDTMRDFWNFLLIRSLPTNALAGLNFAVLGLGDSSYTTYNFASKKLTQRLLSLGAKQMVRRGDADYQHDLGIDYEVERWTKELTDKLIDMYPVPADFKPLDKTVLQPAKYKLVYLNVPDQVSKMLTMVATTQYQYGTLVKNTRITGADWTQDVRHLEIDISTTSLE